MLPPPNLTRNLLLPSALGTVIVKAYFTPSVKEVPAPKNISRSSPPASSVKVLPLVVPEAKVSADIVIVSY